MIGYSGPASRWLPEFHRRARSGIAAAGDWLTGRQRVATWHEFRDARTNPLDRARRAALSPTAVGGAHVATADLPAEAVEVVHRVASDPGRLTRTWADSMIGQLGEEIYTELVGVTAVVSVLDRFSEAMAGVVPDLPKAKPGEPARVRPRNVGDVGAWVAQSLAAPKANVSRTLSLVPVTNRIWRALVDSHYSRGHEFFEEIWDRSLTRPQAELVAARTTALNECFY